MGKIKRILKNNRKIVHQLDANEIFRHKDNIITLIRFYSGHECLWNPNHEEYFNQTKKNGLWSWIAKQFGPGITQYDVKAKMHTMHNQALQELERMQTYTRMGVHFQPVFEYLNEFYFLLDQDVNEDESISTTNSSSIVTDSRATPALSQSKSHIILLVDSKSSHTEGLDVQKNLSTHINKSPSIRSKTFLNVDVGEKDMELDSFLSWDYEIDKSAPSPHGFADSLADNVSTSILKTSSTEHLDEFCQNLYEELSKLPYPLCLKTKKKLLNVIQNAKVEKAATMMHLKKSVRWSV